jgi:hypothetical protein
MINSPLTIQMRQILFVSSLMCLPWLGVNPVLATDGYGQEIHPTLKEVVDTADGVCQKPPLVHTSEGYRLNGDANLKLAGFLKPVANAGIGGGGEKHWEKEQRAILERDIVTALRDGQPCRLTVFNRLEDERQTILRRQDQTPSGTTGQDGGGCSGQTIKGKEDHYWDVTIATNKNTGNFVGRGGHGEVNTADAQVECTPTHVYITQTNAAARNNCNYVLNRSGILLQGKYTCDRISGQKDFDGSIE